ncbi:MAG: tRNA uridine-5-carboxymethylaminomethyl(34) synthesis GTPase MnmE [Candidatus Brocadia sp.]|jgi:tRNA modification GTPase
MYPGIQDTIVAVSTPPGRSFHAIIKISGPEAVPCIKDLFIPTNPADLETVSTYHSVRGYIRSPGGFVNVPVLLYIMRKPYSYTREDVVEIHTIGSPPLTEILLDQLLLEGLRAKRRVRLSHPGEFTKRAFLYGRIDLTQAEATMRIIRAQTDIELKMAIAQLAGDVSQEIKRIQDEAVSLCSHIEASIDFSDQDIELISITEILDRLSVIKKNISRLLVHQETGKVSQEGINTVLYGKPNVGKSSLINALLGKNRAIVSEIPGTTRDIVTGILETGGFRFKLTDTAGVDDTKGTVLSMAMEKTRFIIKSAQLLLLVFDGSADLEKQFREIKLDELTNNVIVIINKCDLQKDGHNYELPMALKNCPVVHTSAMTGEGLVRMKELLTWIVQNDKTFISAAPSMLNVRQRETLRLALLSIQQAVESAKNNESHEFIALDLHAAIDALGEITGKVTTEDILDKIFSEFCIGK